jgi:hypothetical protein
VLPPEDILDVTSYDPLKVMDSDMPNKLLYGFLITPGNLAVDKKSRLNADNF